MKAYLNANASWWGDSVRRYNDMDVNYVMGNREMLVVLIIDRVEIRGLGSISKEIRGHLDRITPDEDMVVEGFATADEGMGTVTVMNLGMYRVKSCAPIIRELQALALAPALGTADTRVVPRDIDMNDAEDGGKL